MYYAIASEWKVACHLANKIFLRNKFSTLLSIKFEQIQKIKEEFILNNIFFLMQEHFLNSGNYYFTKTRIGPWEEEDPIITFL